MIEIVLATRNRKKAEEIQRILSNPDIKLLTLDDVAECPEVIEDRDTFEGNALKKAVTIAQCTNLIAIADDSGLEVDALGGAPGVKSARFAGVNANDSANIEKLLKELRDVPDEKRTARFVCCIAIAYPEGKSAVFFGYVHGRIGRVPKGERGFGYDPVFYPDGFDLTFAEMPPEKKDSLSHRREALCKLNEYLQTILAINA
jgi:XTP/dITP diphosphohydrolase